MTSLHCSCRGVGTIRVSSSRPLRRVNRLVTRAAETKENAPTTSGTPTSPGPEKPTFVREFSANGARIIETDGKLSGPEDEKDFWEGDNMENFGRFMERFFIPGLIVLGIICGSIAARSYNEDADVFIAPPTGPDADIVIIPAGAIAPAPVVESATAPTTSE